MRQTITPGAAPDGRLDQALVEAQLEQVLDRVHDGVVLTSNGRATLNAAARRILAAPEGLDFRSSMFEPRALDGTPFAVDPGQVPGAEAIRNDTGGPFRIRVTALDGRELVLDGSVSPVVDGAVIVFRDVTDEHLRERAERAHAERALRLAPRRDRRRRARFRRARESERRVLRARRPGRGGGGRSESAVPMVGAGCGARAPRSVPRPSRSSGCRTAGRVRSRSRRARSPAPTARPRSCSALISDTSEERRMQQQLVQSGKLAAIGELAAGVAHEINNPLFAILGLTEFLLKEARARLEGARSASS